MQTFTLKELIDFIRGEPERWADYAHPNVEEGTTSCLMCQFFVSKGVDFAGVNIGGDSALDANDNVVASIELPGWIGEVHHPHPGSDRKVQFSEIYANMQIYWASALAELNQQ